MAYRVLIRRKAQKRLDAIREEDRERIIGAIFALSEEPRPPGCRKLRGREEWRIRMGNYRAIYTIDDDGHVIEILKVAHRREAYR